MHERDLRGVARAVEHALAEEGAAERDAVESADELVAVIDLDGVAMAALEQCAVDAADARIDPGAGAVLLGFGAALDHRVEVAVDMDCPATWSGPCARAAPGRETLRAE